MTIIQIRFFWIILRNVFKIVESSNKCIITGDLNYDLLNLENTHVSNFVELMHKNYYLPVINKPTRFGDSSATVRDHIWTNLYSHQVKSGAILAHYLTLYQCTYV